MVKRLRLRLILLATVYLLPSVIHNTESKREEIMSLDKMLFLVNNVHNVEFNHLNLIYDCSETHGLSPALIMNLIFVESSYKYDSVSYADAVGYFQITKIAQECVNKRTENEYDRYVVEDNIRIGILFLSLIVDRFEGNIIHALRYYNGGNKYESIPDTLTYANKIIGG